MMFSEVIELDYTILAKRKTVAEVSRRIGEDEIDIDVLVGEVYFAVGGIEVPVGGYVPLIDVARGLYLAEVALSPKNPIAYLELLDFEARVRFTLIGENVELASELESPPVVCPRDALHEHFRVFGSRIMREALAYYLDPTTRQTLKDAVPPAFLKDELT